MVFVVVEMQKGKEIPKEGKLALPSAKTTVLHTSFDVTHDTGSLFHSKVPESQLGTVRP